jgi:prepilin peptidase CpaA
MTNLIDADLLFFIALVPVCLIVAYNDLKYMKIPNWTVITMIVIFVVLGFIVLPLNVFLWRFAGLVVALIAGFILSAMKMMGAGDAKFMAAAALFVSPIDAGYVVIMLALMGPVALLLHRIAGSLFAAKMLPEWESWQRKREFPMGLPLTASLLIYLAYRAFF